MSVKGNILWYADSPFCPSGFGTVSRGIIENIIDDWRIHVFAINYNSQYDRDELYDHPNFSIEPCNLRTNDGFGRDNLYQMADRGPFDYDILFCLQDSFILSSLANIENLQQHVPMVTVLSRACRERDASLVTYFPIDATPKAQWIEPVLEASDQAVTYTDWGKGECIDSLKLLDIDKYSEEDIEVIYHGTDLDNFYEIEDYAKKTDKDFVLGYVGRNQRRKQIPHNVIKPFLRFYRKHPNTQLLLKTDPNNPEAGWDLQSLIDRWTKEHEVSRSSVKLYKPNEFLSVEEMNEFYNEIDGLILPSMEGWGLPYTEAIATKTPTITADTAALSEIGGDGKSLQIDVPDDPNHRIVFTRDNDVERDLPCIQDTVEKMEQLMNMPEDEKKAMVEKAYKWAESIQWEDIAGKWDKMFTKQVWSDKGARKK